MEISAGWMQWRPLPTVIAQRRFLASQKSKALEYEVEGRDIQNEAGVVEFIKQPPRWYFSSRGVLQVFVRAIKWPSGCKYWEQPKPFCLVFSYAFPP